MKYYYVHTVYDSYNSGDWRPQCFVCDKHPFDEVHRLNVEIKNYETILCSWQEITEAEYLHFKQL